MAQRPSKCIGQVYRPGLGRWPEGSFTVRMTTGRPPLTDNYSEMIDYRKSRRERGLETDGILPAGNLLSSVYKFMQFLTSS